MDTLVTLLADDAVLEMPPVPLWYAGRVDYGRFIARVFTMRGTGWRMVPTAANGQPAVAAYCPDNGVLRALVSMSVEASGGGSSRWPVRPRRRSWWERWRSR